MSSLTRREPSCATATPTGRAQTLLSSITKPVRKSYPPMGWPFVSKTRTTLYTVRVERFQEPWHPAVAPSAIGTDIDESAIYLINTKSLIGGCACGDVGKGEHFPAFRVGSGSGGLTAVGTAPRELGY